MKKLIFLMFICIAFTVKCLAQNAENDTVTTYNNYSLFSDSVIAFGKNYLSVPYRSGGMSANGFDCSGFTSFVYKNFGYQLARTSDGQAQQVNKIKKDDLQRGDLVFFNGRKRGARIGHVGMITDVKTDGSFDFIHASVKGVRITNSEQNYYKQRYMGAGRVFADANQLSKRQKPDKKTEKQKNETEATEIKTETETKVVTQEIAEIKELAKVNEQNNDDKLLYIVHQGDTLYSISRTYGCSVEQLRQWNNKQNNELKIGEEILILN